MLSLRILTRNLIFFFLKKIIVYFVCFFVNFVVKFF